MTNEVRIIVRSHNDTARGFQQARTDVTRWADESAKMYTERFARNMETFGRQTGPAFTRGGREIGEQLGDSTSTSFARRFLENVTQVVQRARSTFSRAGQTIGQDIGAGISESVSRSIREGVTRGADGRDRDSRGRFVSSSTSSSRSTGTSGGGDRDTDRNRFQSWIAGAARAGVDAAKSFGSTFASNVGSFFSGDLISLVLKSAGIATLGAVLAVPLAAAITTAIGLALGGGAIAVGIAGAFKDPRIQAAAKELGGKLNKAFEEFGKPFRGPVADFLEKFTSKFMPQLEKAGRKISEAFAPLTGDIGNGIIGMLQNMLPGITDAMINLKPVVQVLADRLPEIGQAIGDFFRRISEQGDDASVFFNDLISFVIKLIGWTANLIATFTSAYANIRSFVSKAKGAFMDFLAYIIMIFGRILDAADQSMSWIPGLGSKIKAAKGRFADLRRDINGELNKIHDKTVTVRMRVLGLAAANAAIGVASRLSAMGYAHGGIKGAQDGGMKSGMTWVGERGPELVQLPTGSTVRTSGDSMRMMRDGMKAAGMGGGQGGGFMLRADPSMEGTVIGALVRALRLEVSRAAGGSSEQFWGRTA